VKDVTNLEAQGEAVYPFALLNAFFGIRFSDNAGAFSVLRRKEKPPGRQADGGILEVRGRGGNPSEQVTKCGFATSQILTFAYDVLNPLHRIHGVKGFFHGSKNR
jgi:hypothetical protein